MKDLSNGIEEQGVLLNLSRYTKKTKNKFDFFFHMLITILAITILLRCTEQFRGSHGELRSDVS